MTVVVVIKEVKLTDGIMTDDVMVKVALVLMIVLIVMMMVQLSEWAMVVAALKEVIGATVIVGVKKGC